MNLTAGQVRGNLSIAVMSFGSGVLAVGFFVVGLPLLFRPCSQVFGPFSPQGARLFPVGCVELIPVGAFLSLPRPDVVPAGPGGVFPSLPRPDGVPAGPGGAA